MRGGRPVIREVFQTAVLTLVIFFMVRAGVQNFRVDGLSMEPNLQNGEYILVNKVDYLLHPPQRGDIIVFRAVPAGQPNRDYIKRVIGLPGETVAVRDGAVYINGRRLTEPYISIPPDYTFAPEKVPANEYFVLGDNRSNSRDSHIWKWLPRNDIIGKAWVAYWPPASIHLYGALPATSGVNG